MVYVGSSFNVCLRVSFDIKSFEVFLLRIEEIKCK